MIHGYHEHEHSYHMFCKYKLGRWCQMGVSVKVPFMLFGPQFFFCHKGSFMLVNDFNMKIMETSDFMSRHLEKPSQF